MADALRSSGVLVGRSAELRSLVDLTGLDRGGDRVVLLAGDAGVGKTRLIAELRAHALAAGWRVLVGHCLDFGGDAMAYLPFTELFAQLAAESPDLVATAVQAGPALARLLPGQRLLSAGRAGSAASAASPASAGSAASAGPQAAERSELFEAVHQALQQLHRAEPVLLVVEDLHWADASTRELLSYLFSRESGPSILASYRTDDLHRRHPLRATATQWSRLARVARLHLDPLAEPAVRALVLALEPGGLPGADVDRIVARAEGNPFFTEELVAAAVRGERVLSADLSDLLLLHLDQLAADARTVLRAVSVAGRQVPHALLARVVGDDHPDLEGALRVAVDHNLLVATRSGGYAFRHALLAEAVYDDLLPGERVRWHRAYAEALLSGEVEGTAAELARHAGAGHDFRTAIAASRRAGDEAMVVGGPAEATRHYEQSLALVAENPAAAAGVDVVDLALRASESAVAAGSLHRALALVQDQLAQLPADADPTQRVLLLHAIAGAALLDETAIDALPLTTEALRLLGTTAGPLRARVLAVHARAHADRRRNDEALRWATQAAALARELGLPAVLADATTTLTRLTRDADPERAETSLRSSIAEARDAGDAATELRSIHNLGNLLYELGRLAEAQAAFDLAADRALELRRPWAPYGLDGRAMSALVRTALGDWDGAERLVDTNGQAPPPPAQALLDAVGLGVRAGRGDAAGLELLTRLRPWWERDGLIAVTCAAAAIDLHGDAGHVEAAVAAYDDVVAVVGALWEQPDFQARIRLSGLLLGQLCGCAREVGRRERAGIADRGRRVHADAVRTAAGAPNAGPESGAWLARVEAEHVRLRRLTGDDAVDRDDLVRVWEVAATAFEQYGNVYELARTRARLAAALRAAGQPGAAGEQAALAARAAQALRAGPLLRELSGPAQSAAASAHLTAREHEVLLLLAQGRSNGEIGKLLFISTKTVSVHVSNILAKLQASGRTEAVAIARRTGLLNAG